MTARSDPQLEEQRYAAMLAGDVATLERLLDDALTYTHSNGVVDTKASYIAGVRDKVWEYKAISRENERVVIRGGCGARVLPPEDRSRWCAATPRKVDSNALARVGAKTGPSGASLAVHSAGCRVELPSRSGAAMQIRIDDLQRTGDRRPPAERTWRSAGRPRRRKAPTSWTSTACACRRSPSGACGMGRTSSDAVR